MHDEKTTALDTSPEPTATCATTATTATTAPAGTDDGRELRRLPTLAAAIRAHRLHLLVGMALGLVAGLLVAGLTQPTYAATSTVRVGSGLVPVGDFRPDTLWAEDQVALTRTPPVREAIAEEIGDGTTADDVARRLGVVAETNSNYLVFTWTDDDAEEAEERADTAAEVYLERAQAEAVQRWESHDALLADLIAAYDADDPRAAELVEERVLLEETVVDPGKIAGAAAGTARQTSLTPAAHVLAGLLGGLLLGLVSAYLWHLRSPNAPRQLALAGAGAGAHPGAGPDAGPDTARGGGLAGAVRRRRGAARDRVDGEEPAPELLGSDVDVPATELAVLAAVRRDAPDGALATIGLGVTRWLLRREQEDPGAELRLGVYVTPDLDPSAADLVRRGVRAVGADGRLEIDLLDVTLPNWRIDFEACDGVVVVVGTSRWAADALDVARMHLAAVDVTVLGRVEVEGVE
ncbi:hypothetical protein INN71_03785 [Nocardioides sp. ChNu-153]|uniref:hypothetical protein n=1 Tax=unclassified Nocardioides TaxID=2615069 RepID=UPI002405DC91|nr:MULTISPECIES: hypothetical protein [unclassified Nocardioides]MDF9717275.1 hypothetical protein [Nocardioides sp. ChNu-99]MDN7120509.1 hypothetical protein [Nocardioides sp. ChNu-153]